MNPIRRSFYELDWVQKSEIVNAMDILSDHERDQFPSFRVMFEKFVTKAFELGVSGELEKRISAYGVVVPKAKQKMKVNWKDWKKTLIDADSEMSAIAHGRPADKDELKRIYPRVRDIYEHIQEIIDQESDT